MNPKVTQRDPKRGQGRPKASQKGVQWRPRGTQKYLLAPKRELKGGLYTQKLPINRTSGRYVISLRKKLHFNGNYHGYRWIWMNKS